MIRVKNILQKQYLLYSDYLRSLTRLCCIVGNDRDITAADNFYGYPQNLVAVATGNQVDLSWTNAYNNATGTIVEISEDGINYTDTAYGSVLTSSQYTGLSGDKTYYFRVRLSLGLSLSPYSNVATVYIQPSLVVSDIEGNEYTTVVIGTQEWIVENFRTTKYADGSDIPNIISSIANKITTWQTSDDPFNVFEFIGADVSRAYRSINSYAKRDTNLFSAVTGDKLIININYHLTSGAKPGFSLVLFNGFVFDEVISLTDSINEGDNNIEYTLLADRNIYFTVNTSSITDFSLSGFSIVIEGEKVWTTDIDGGYCAYDNDEDNIPIYGLLYNWHAVDNIAGLAYLERNGIQETGWRIPTVADFNLLSTSLGGDLESGGKIKEEGLTHWMAPNTGADNSSGFTLLPSGYRDGWEGMSENITELGTLWSSEAMNPTSSSHIIVNTDTTELNVVGASKRYGIAVRLVRDI